MMSTQCGRIAAVVIVTFLWLVLASALNGGLLLVAVGLIWLLTADITDLPEEEVGFLTADEGIHLLEDYVNEMGTK